MARDKDKRRKYQREYHRKYSKLPGVKEKHEARRKRREYGITNEQYLELLATQGGRCAICSDKLIVPCIDHDHATNKIRGILCRECNLVLGYAKDRVAVLINAAEYLENSCSRIQS